MSDFPKYGRCPVCGGKGKDDAYSGSQHSAEDHAGAGYMLDYYRGELMCNMCKKRLIQREETAGKNAKYQANQEFLEDMGVRKTME